jgi:adhesin/invasin
VRIGVHPDFAGGLIDITGPSATTWMRTTAVSAGGSITGDSGAVFEITAPVTIDLENRLRAAPPNNTAVPSAAVFHVNGPDITLQGIDNSWGAETTFYVGPDASDVHITGGVMATPNANPKRFMVVRGGATNVRLSDYEVSGFASNGTTQGWGFVDGSSAAAPVSGLVIEGVTYSAAAAGACNATSSAGCSSSPMSLRNQTVTDFALTNSAIDNFGQAVNSSSRIVDLRGATVEALRFEGNSVSAARMYPGNPVIDFGTTAATAAQVRDFDVSDNDFRDTAGTVGVSVGFLHLPQGAAISGSGAVRGNWFGGPMGSNPAALSTAGSAVFWAGPKGSALNAEPSGVVVEDNVFRGWGDADRAAVHLSSTGAVTMQRNNFVWTRGTADPIHQEEGASARTTTRPFTNGGLAANGQLNTWWPTARHHTAGQTQILNVERCVLEMEIASPTDPGVGVAVSNARFPSSPVQLDFYWGFSVQDFDRGSPAVYLESMVIEQSSRQTVRITLPAPGDPRISHLLPTDPVPISPTDGSVRGMIRIQTQDLTGEQTISSQYSRWVSISGSCRADLTIDQAEEQNDPTLARDLHYTVTSSIPLDPEQFTTDSIAFTAEPTEHTIDAERLNPRAVSVAPVEGTDNTEFSVIARVDDSAVVTAAIEPGRATAESGVTNIDAATSADNQITFTNPVVLDPSLVTLVTGSGEGTEYTLSTRPGAPVPSDDLRFTTALDSRGTELGVTLGSPDPVLPAGSDTTGPLTVTVGSPDLDENNLSVLVGHTVASADTNYDGLVVQTLDVRLFSTNPDLEITKQAFIDVGDTSSPESVLQTGTEALAGSRLSDGQPVCWVYTVTNTSADDWATALTDIEVRDTDTRLGRDGLIGTLPELAVGATHRLHACAVLIPVDTRPAA